MTEAPKVFGRCIVSPKGEAFFCGPMQEHYEVCEKVVKERGKHEKGYDASRVLEQEGWVRVSDYGFTTPAYFNKVKHLTQAQRDTIFDMAMAQLNEGDEWAARNLVKCLDEVPEEQAA